MRRKLMGRWGEEVAARFLQARGYRLLAAGYRCRFGEIDLIFKQGATVVFVEVKLRKSAEFAPAADQVNAAKRQRLRAAAQMWLAEKEDDSPCRFDVVEVYAAEPGREPDRINHIEDAFS